MNPGISSGDGMAIAGHRPHTDASLDDSQASRRGEHARRALEQLRRPVRQHAGESARARTASSPRRRAAGRRSRRAGGTPGACTTTDGAAAPGGGDRQQSGDLADCRVTPRGLEEGCVTVPHTRGSIPPDFAAVSREPSRPDRPRARKVTAVRSRTSAPARRRGGQQAAISRGASSHASAEKNATSWTRSGIRQTGLHRRGTLSTDPLRGNRGPRGRTTRSRSSRSFSSPSAHSSERRRGNPASHRAHARARDARSSRRRSGDGRRPAPS